MLEQGGRILLLKPRDHKTIQRAFKPGSVSFGRFCKEFQHNGQALRCLGAQLWPVWCLSSRALRSSRMVRMSACTPL